jgi:hypothetical protein
MQTAPEITAKAERYIADSGWALSGNENPTEKAQLMAARSAAVAWLAGWRAGNEPYWLVLHGESGTGKTLLARTLARCVAKNGERVYRIQHATGKDYLQSYGYAQSGPVFAMWADLVPHGRDNQERYGNAKTDWVKVVDDLMPKTGQQVVIDGTEGLEPKRFEVTAALDLMDARARKWTVLTTNLTREQFALFWDVRIASRLTRDGNVCVDLTGVRDYELRRKK